LTLEQSFGYLRQQLLNCRDAVAALHVMLTIDCPPEGDSALVDTIADSADDLLGALNDTVTAAHQAQLAAEHPRDAHRVRLALTTCQRSFNRCEQQFSIDLMSYERIADLIAFGKERGGEWQGWTTSVKEALDRCRPPLYDVTHALLLCWQDVAERAEAQPLSITTTNIGQQIGYPERNEPKGREVS
jgi:hypothetical protein